MPNWCDNYITISGSQEQISKIIEDLGDHEEWMERLVPLNGKIWDKIVEEKEYLISPLTPFYGSKWGMNRSDCHLFEIWPDYIQINVQSAWSPFAPFCQKVSEKYEVDVTIEFAESGNNFAGRHEYKNGVLIEQIEESYDKGLYLIDNDQFWMETSDSIEWRTSNNEDWENIQPDYAWMEDPDDLRYLKDLYTKHKESNDID